MNAEIINLRRAKKKIARIESERVAEANRQKFGQTKTERQLTKAERSRAHKNLDGHKRDT